MRCWLAGLASTLVFLGCAEPECPVGTYKIRNICRKVDAGAELTSEEAGVRSGDGGGDIDPETGAPIDAANPDAAQRGQDDAARPGSDAGPAPDDGGLSPEDSGRTCDAGFEPNGADRCADIDECARSTDDCDHDPQACVNTSGGVSCACPTGFRGTGKGTNGCVDIDECAEGMDSCDSQVTCNNTPGSYSCGACPAGFSPGDAGACVDIDECASNNGGCDTSPMATCNNRVGMSNTCSCPTGYAGNGVGANGCTDPCAPNPCGVGFSCTRSTQGMAVCSATCAASGGPGCMPGDTCATDADCRIGGDNTATCHATDKVCLRVCPATILASQLNLTAARYCREVNGALTINPDFATIASTDLPYLTRVRGDLNLGHAGGNNTARSITLGAVTTVDGSIVCSALVSVGTLSMPRLTNVGTNAIFQIMTGLQHLSLPQLRTVPGNFTLSGATNLSQLDLNSLQSAGGSMQFYSLCQLPPTQVSGYADAQFLNVGCCVSSVGALMCSGGCTCN